MVYDEIERVAVLGFHGHELHLAVAHFLAGVVRAAEDVIYQGKVAVSAIHMTAKQPGASGKGITMTALVETYAILALLISILLVVNL